MPIKADNSLRAYYNEIDPAAAQWLRNLMADGWITKGDVDERSIEDVRPDELSGYDRAHFFAGIGVWDYALNQAEWGSSEVWTGSCPCQPFSAAGKGAGFNDKRHVWPAFEHLIRQCKPAIVFGEQVAAKAVEPWIDLVHADMESMGYAFGCVPFPSAGVGAPHIRDRAYWVADANSGACRQGSTDLCRLDNTDITRSQGHAGNDGATGRQGPAGSVAKAGLYGGLADTNKHGCDPRHGIRLHGEKYDAKYGGSQSDKQPGPVNGFWRDADWLKCRDDKWRPVKSGTFPLVNGASARVVRLRAYGNSICSEAAQVFIKSVMEAA